MQLRTENIVKKYRSRTVVKEVSVDVRQGEIVGLLGPNGAGKTTTFYMRVGIIKPFSGRVFLDPQPRKEKLESLIREFGLDHIRTNKGIQLSGGERRRTEIARALANDPKFLLLDEPFAGVDPIAVQDIQDIVAHLKDRNIGILITDHNVHETLSITDRAYLLYEGRVLHHGTPEEMAADPDVREKYLGRDFELRRASTQAIN